jgi:peptidoglycan/xylan/chitin deacetylase (PgdA/CDA1 family)
MRRRAAKWRPFMRIATPITFICGIIAVVYFFYRAALLAVPAVSFEQHLLHPMGDSGIVCGQEEGSNLKDPSPIISTKYQSYINAQPATANMVVNSDLKQLDPVSELPVGYSQNTEAEIGTFEYLQDMNDKQLFLRATNRTKPADPTPSWLIDPVNIKKDHTYAYSFSYRSNIPVNVTLERTTDSKQTYQRIVTLKSTSTWQNVTAHFHNADAASAFRILLVGKETGYVDSRGFNVHEIPDARLSEGVVTVAFDDGWRSVKEGALPLLEKYGVRTTQYIISEVAEQNIQEYMDIGSVTQLHQAGHEVGSHSLRHCNQTTLSKDKLKEDASKSKAILEQRGLGPVRSFAYPLGQYSEATQDIYSRYYPLIRTSDFGYNDRYFDPTNIRSMGVVSSTNDREFKGWLDYAKVHRLWVVIVYHRIDEAGLYNVTRDQLERQLRMISGSGLKIVPLSEAADFVRR